MSIKKKKENEFKEVFDAYKPEAIDAFIKRAKANGVI